MYENENWEKYTLSKICSKLNAIIEEEYVLIIYLFIHFIFK